MVKHIVMFKLKGSGEERRRVASAFRDALLQLPGQIPVLRSIEVELSNIRDSRWDAVVDKMTDVEVYAKHPAHVAAASLLGANKELRACVDYEC